MIHIKNRHMMIVASLGLALGLLLGLSTVVINLVLFGFFEFYKNYIKEA